MANDTIFPTTGELEVAVADDTLALMLADGLTATPLTYDKPGGLSKGRQRFTVRGPAGWLHIAWEGQTMRLFMGEAPQLAVTDG